MDDDLWERLDQAAKAADPDSNRSVVLRKFARWFVGDIDEMPRRPELHPDYAEAAAWLGEHFPTWRNSADLIENLGVGLQQQYIAVVLWHGMTHPGAESDRPEQRRVIVSRLVRKADDDLTGRKFRTTGKLSAAIDTILFEGTPPIPLPRT